MDPVALAGRLDAEFRTTCGALDRDEPWFGSLDVVIDGSRRAYRVGRDRVPDHRILDWRHPLASLHYDHTPGEEFELDDSAPRGFVALSGRLEATAAIVPRARAVERVDIRSRSGSVTLVAGAGGFELEGPRGLRRPESGLPEVLALLTPEQYRLITTGQKNPLIVQGRAGSGKTSIALHRVAWLTYADQDSTDAPVDPAKVLIVMFNKALSMFVRSALKPLKLEAATLDTFHGWALAQVRRAYAGELRMETKLPEGHEVALALKKQVGILRAIDAFVARQERALDKWLPEKLAPYRAKDWMDKLRAASGPVQRRLVALRSQALAARDLARGTEQKRLAQIHLVFQTAVRRMQQYKEELLRLLTDEVLLAEHLTASPAELATLAAYQRALQQEGGTERRPGPRIAFDDLALLLRLIEVKNGGFPDKEREDDVQVYDHLVIDEAQDFGAVELAVLLGAVNSRTGVTVVGDLNQKILPEIDFIGWEALAGELGLGGAVVTRLEVAHRATRQIMAIADGLVGDGTRGGRDGALPTLRIVNDDSEKFERAAQAAMAAITESPAAHVCVVCTKAGDVSSAFEEIRQRVDPAVPVRQGHNKDFVFAPGITVTNYRQVKGLEFDVVVVLDPTGESYPDTVQGRRNLYMVITRAKDALHLVAAAEPTPLLKPAIDAGLLDLRDETTVPEVVLTSADEEPFLESAAHQLIRTARRVLPGLSGSTRQAWRPVAERCLGDVPAPGLARAERTRGQIAPGRWTACASVRNQSAPRRTRSIGGAAASPAPRPPWRCRTGPSRPSRFPRTFGQRRTSEQRCE